MIIYLMLLVHLLYDFHWQGVFIGEYKSKYPFIMFVHSFTWALIVYLPLLYFTGIFAPILFSFLIFSHYVIDTWKCNELKKGKKMWLVYVDQVLHLVSILIVWYVGINL